MEIQNFIKDGKFSIKPEKYAIIKSSKMVTKDIFAAINDDNEITIIAKQGSGMDYHHDLLSKDIIEEDKNWKIITFDMELPFELVGFVATIATTLANEGISIFVVSAFSTDHILVKENNLGKTTELLEKIGFKNQTK